MGDIWKWCPMCGAMPGEPCKSVRVHWARSSDTKPVVLIPDEPAYATVYEEAVPENLRRDVQAKFERWVFEGRNSNEIESLVKSLVLEAYTWQWPTHEAGAA